MLIKSETACFCFSITSRIAARYCIKLEELTCFCTCKLMFAMNYKLVNPVLVDKHVYLMISGYF